MFKTKHNALLGDFLHHSRNNLEAILFLYLPNKFLQDSYTICFKNMDPIVISFDRGKVWKIIGYYETQSSPLKLWNKINCILLKLKLLNLSQELALSSFDYSQGRIWRDLRPAVHAEFFRERDSVVFYKKKYCAFIFSLSVRTHNSYVYIF